MASQLSYAAAQVETGDRSRVSKRCVFYVSGFDPKGAAHYHTLYRDESEKQNTLNQLRVQVGPRQRLANGNSFWRVTAQEDGLESQTHYEFLRWDDIVRRHWPRHDGLLWRDVLVTSLLNVVSGLWWRMFCLSWPPALAVGLPFVLLSVLLFGLPVLTLGAFELVYGVTRSVWWAGALAALVAFFVALAGRTLESRYSMYWLMRSYTFTRHQGLGKTPDLEQRLDEHAERLAKRLEDASDDEVLVVGHSSGAIMAASIVARALSKLDTRSPGASKRLSLLTLGQWIPLLGLQAQADQFRAELRLLADAPGLDWIDFSAPPDGCCFALNDPLVTCGVSGGSLKSPKLLNPRFIEMFARGPYQAMRRDKLRMHFQYLMSSDQSTAYDYFKITAGGFSLADRFASESSVVNYRGLRPFA